MVQIEFMDLREDCRRYVVTTSGILFFHVPVFKEVQNYFLMLGQ